MEVVDHRGRNIQFGSSPGSATHLRDQSAWLKLRAAFRAAHSRMIARRIWRSQAATQLDSAQGIAASEAQAEQIHNPEKPKPVRRAAIRV